MGRPLRPPVPFMNMPGGVLLAFGEAPRARSFQVVQADFLPAAEREAEARKADTRFKKTPLPALASP